MNNYICENGFGAILRSITFSLEYQENLIIFLCFLEIAEN